ncbi:hypothetical protein GCM10025857_22060 [Alicyclobacillus contaminans]|uniref:hypothetical protein n=1 Tax=Alicyclobacillus contaminans TaxID=392016 RepID=UPI00041AD107|nr:hypothetical protein [Alicyclobacillus contaminans]GMA50849.1 hypothetical protein GCM10025857_22060 [Alicyclobacillus contaminans]
MKRLGDLTFGIVYSGKEKVGRKVRKWTGIVRDPVMRQRWETRILEQGQMYRQEVMERVRTKLLGSRAQSNTALATKPIRRARVRQGQKVEFYALNKACRMEGVVSAADFDPTGEFFLVNTYDQFGASQTYICRDCGDSIIGDVEF